MSVPCWPRPRLKNELTAPVNIFAEGSKTTDPSSDVVCVQPNPSHENPCVDLELEPSFNAVTLPRHMSCPHTVETESVALIQRLQAGQGECT